MRGLSGQRAGRMAGHDGPMAFRLIRRRVRLAAGNGRGGAGWFGRAVGGIGGASFLSDVGHEVPTALLPSFLTSVLGAPASALG